MRTFLGTIAVIGVYLSFAPGSAQAQLIGSVVHNGSMGPGVKVAGDYTRGINDDAGKANYFGGRIAVGLPRFSLWGGLGVVTTGDAQTTFGGGIAAKVITGPLLPIEVSLQGGIGYQSENGDNSLNIPLGVAGVIDVPNPAVEIKPWAMPRINIWRSDPDVGDSQTEVGFGISGGLIVNAPTGVGAHATLDWMTIDSEGSDITPLRLNFGIHYRISVPSLGIM